MFNFNDFYENLLFIKEDNMNTLKGSSKGETDFLLTDSYNTCIMCHHTLVKKQVEPSKSHLEHIDNLNINIKPSFLYSYKLGGVWCKTCPCCGWWALCETTYTEDDCKSIIFFTKGAICRFDVDKIKIPVLLIKLFLTNNTFDIYKPKSYQKKLRDYLNVEFGKCDLFHITRNDLNLNNFIEDLYLFVYEQEYFFIEVVTSLDYINIDVKPIYQIYKLNNNKAGLIYEKNPSSKLFIPSEKRPYQNLCDIEALNFKVSFFRIVNKKRFNEFVRSVDSGGGVNGGGNNFSGLDKYLSYSLDDLKNIS